MVALGFIRVYFPDPGYKCVSLAGYRQTILGLPDCVLGKAEYLSMQA